MPELEALSKRVEKFAKTVWIKSPSASVLVLPRGGRILGIELTDANLLWVNPDIEEVLQKGEWNTGGIRTWVSPERAFFHEEPENYQGWRCPPGIDPAEYQVKSTEPCAVELESPISCKDMFSGEILKGTIRKRFELGKATSTKRAQHVQIRIQQTLTAPSFKSSFALWTLIQVPPGDDGKGELVIPTVWGVQSIHYFDPIPSSYLRVLTDHVRFTVDGRKVFKLGIRPEDLKDPRLAQLEYRFKKNGKNIVILMSSRTAAKNQNECVNQAKSNPDGPRAVIESYNSDLKESGLCFGELEIQGARARIQPDGCAVAQDEIFVDFGLKAE